MDEVPVPTQTAASPASDAMTGDALPWETVVARRRGAPPLRFAGREVCRVEEAGLFVRIWRARSGGFVMAHSVEDGDTAERHATADAAMAALEGYCSALDDLGSLPEDLRAVRRLHLADLLDEVARLTLWRQRFRRLAGSALDLLDAWAALQPPQMTKGAR
jgi:hypothetical protein